MKPLPENPENTKESQKDNKSFMNTRKGIFNIENDFFC
jgi:hypothetical protein